VEAPFSPSRGLFRLLASALMWWFSFRGVWFGFYGWGRVRAVRTVRMRVMLVMITVVVAAFWGVICLVWVMAWV